MRHKAVRLPDDLYTQLEQTAQAEERTVSQVIRRILTAHYNGSQIMIQFRESDLSDNAQALLHAARSASEHMRYITAARDGLVAIVLRDNSDDEFGVPLTSTLTMAERMRRFGVAILEGNEVRRDERGVPMRSPVGNAPIPTEEYIADTIRMYGDRTDGHHFSLDSCSPRLQADIVSRRLSGAEAFNAIADELMALCSTGCWALPA